MQPEAPPSPMPPLLKPGHSCHWRHPSVWQEVWQGLGLLWRTPANWHPSWKPEWLLVQHTWLTLLEPEHCPPLGPTLTTTAGRCVGAALARTAASDIRHYCHPARLTCGPGSALPPSHTAKEEAAAKGPGRQGEQSPREPEARAPSSAGGPEGQAGSPRKPRPP